MLPDEDEVEEAEELLLLLDEDLVDDEEDSTGRLVGGPVGAIVGNLVKLSGQSN